jgi:hypothetical protein
MTLAHWSLYLQLLGYILFALWKLFWSGRKEDKRRYNTLIARVEKNEREYLKFRLRVAAKFGWNGDL